MKQWGLLAPVGFYHSRTVYCATVPYTAAIGDMRMVSLHSDCTLIILSYT